MIKTKYPIMPLGNIAADEKAAIKIGPFGSQLKKSELVNSGIHVLGIENVINNQFDGFGDRYISEEKFLTLQSVEVKPGDILITMMGTIGELAIVPEGTGTSIMDSHLLRFRPNTDLCDRKYIIWTIKCSAAVKQSLNRNARGAIMRGLNSGIIKELPIPLPPLPEQRRIAAILDKADAIRRKRQQAIKITGDFLRATFLDIFGDPVINPKGWPTPKLIEIVDKRRPITYGILKPGPDIIDGIPYIRVVDMKDGVILVDQVRKTTESIANQYQRSILKAGDLLLSIRGHVGRLAIVPSELDGGNITQDTARITPRNEHCNVPYLFLCLNTNSFQKEMRRFVKGAAVKGINLGDVKNLKIPLPPKPLQEKIANIQAHISKTIFRQESNYNEAVELFNSISLNAFRGEL
jgi:type I restriction enzyme S subunit